jgi:hypothetical protein
MLVWTILETRRLSRQGISFHCAAREEQDSRGKRDIHEGRKEEEEEDKKRKDKAEETGRRYRGETKWLK